MAFSIEWPRIGRTNASFVFALVACNLSTQVLTDHEPTRGPSARYAHLCIDAVNGEPDLSDVSIKLTRTWGMGSPPQYALRLDGNGRCEYK